jgi:hypothetical protein
LEEQRKVTAVLYTVLDIEMDLYGDSRGVVSEELCDRRVGLKAIARHSLNTPVLNGGDEGDWTAIVERFVVKVFSFFLLVTM